MLKESLGPTASGEGQNPASGNLPERQGSGAAGQPPLPPWMARLTPVSSVRELLDEHSGEILVLPGGRRVPIDALLEHLASCQLASCAHEWAGLPCAVGFEERIDPAILDAPWSAPDAAPCWSRLPGPLFHLWVSRGEAQQPHLFGLIIPDRRANPNITEIVQLLGHEVAEGLPGDSTQRPEPFQTLSHAGIEIKLSDYTVEGPYLSVEQTEKLNLPRPAGEGWWQSWWRVSETPEIWRHGWARWR